MEESFLKQFNDEDPYYWSKLVEEARLMNRHVNIKLKLKESKMKFETLEQQLSQSLREASSISNGENFITVVENLQVPIECKNLMIKCHNEANEMPVYGQTLYWLLSYLSNNKKISRDLVDKIFILSLEWPSHIKIDEI